MERTSHPELAPLRQASRQIVRELGFLAEPEACLGVTRAECHTLIELERGAETSGDLAERLDLDKSSASRAVASLLGRRLVAGRPDRSDSRRRLLRLTAAGRRKLRAVHASADRRVERALALLASEEREAVVRGMGLYARALARARAQEEFSIRKVRPSDDPAVAAIIRKVMPEFGASGPGFAINDPEVDGMHAAYRGRRAGYFVVVRDGKVVGGGGFAPLAGGEAGVCELRKMYFLSEVRGAGMGRKLLRHVLERATRAGFRRCYLETLGSMVQARGLYESEGFARVSKPMGRTGHFGCDAWYVRNL